MALDLLASSESGDNMGSKTRFQKAQAYLEMPERLDAIIKNKLIEQQQWWDMALSITAQIGGERVQSSGGKSKMSDAADRCFDAEREIDEAVAKFAQAKKEVIQTIERLENPTWYKLLHKRYIQYIPLVDIADEWGKDYTTITTMHGRALQSVQQILEEKNMGEH